MNAIFIVSSFMVNLNKHPGCKHTIMHYIIHTYECNLKSTKNATSKWYKTAPQQVKHVLNFIVHVFAS